MTKPTGWARVCVGVCALVCVLVSAPAQAQFAQDVLPDGKVQGAGNIAVPAAGSFDRSVTFWLSLGDPALPASQLMNLEVFVGGQVVPERLNFTSILLQSLGQNPFSRSFALPDNTRSTTVTFSDLAAGPYSLQFSGMVLPATSGPTAADPEWGFSVKANLAAPVPEAADVAMLVLGLAGVSVWLRRRQ